MIRISKILKKVILFLILFDIFLTVMSVFFSFFQNKSSASTKIGLLRYPYCWRCIKLLLQKKLQRFYCDEIGSKDKIKKAKRNAFLK